MMRRCYNPVDTGYPDYGARGITVCEQWHNRSTFIKWALTHGYLENLTIDRKNNSGNYSPSNCKFSNAQEQARNRRSNVHLTAFGITQSLACWSEDPRCVVCYIALSARARNGKMSHKEMLTTPSGDAPCTRQHPLYEAYGRKQTFRQWAEEYGIKRSTLLARISHRTLEEALAMGKPRH